MLHPASDPTRPITFARPAPRPHLTVVAGAPPAEPQAPRSALHDYLRMARAEALPDAEPLTQRERQCLLLVAGGQSDTEIAAALRLGAPTVATHIKNARVKLGAKTRAQAVARFLVADVG